MGMIELAVGSSWTRLGSQFGLFCGSNSELHIFGRGGMRPSLQGTIVSQAPHAYACMLAGQACSATSLLLRELDLMIRARISPCIH